ncbi:MAG: Lsm family RNA-binding protein [Candidatus Hodarchaeota archaeon]
MEARDIASYNKNIGLILESKVKVLLKHKEDYYITGTLKGFSRSSESVFLIDAQDTSGNMFSKIIIKGDDWLTITLEKTPFPMEGLWERLKNVFPPGQVQYEEDVRAISVLGKINVTESGVTGEGPLFERVKKIFESYRNEIEY